MSMFIFNKDTKIKKSSFGDKNKITTDRKQKSKKKNIIIKVIVFIASFVAFLAALAQLIGFSLKDIF